MRKYVTTIDRILFTVAWNYALAVSLSYWVFARHWSAWCFLLLALVGLMPTRLEGT